MNRRSAKLSTNHYRSKFILRPSFRSKFILRPSWSTKFILRPSWSTKFILRPSWSAKFILRFDFLNITVRHEIGKRYRDAKHRVSTMGTIP